MYWRRFKLITSDNKKIDRLKNMVVTKSLSREDIETILCCLAINNDARKQKVSNGLNRCDNNDSEISKQKNCIKTRVDNNKLLERYIDFYRKKPDNYKLSIDEQIRELSNLGIGLNELKNIDLVLNYPFSLLNKNIERLIHHIENNH